MSTAADTTLAAPSWQKCPTRPRAALKLQRTERLAIPSFQIAIWPSNSPSSTFSFSPAPPIRSPRSNVNEIMPRLYISDLAFAENPALLSSYKITHVLSALTNTVFHPPPSQLPNQPIRMQVKLEDLPFAELVAHLPATTAFIREALNSDEDAHVLVHCVEGVSRSVSVVAAFLVAEYGWSPSDAVEHIKSKRRVANPNFGFLLQLHEYSTKLSAAAVCNPPLPATPM